MNDEPPAADPGEWYVAFYSGDERHWWEWGQAPGMGHCMAFAYSSHAERWTIYNVTKDRTYLRVYDPDSFLLWLDTLPPETVILKAPAWPAVPRSRFRAGFWCTIAVKHLLGCPSRALRPKALFRDLLAMGARFAFSTGPSDASQSGSTA